MDKYLITGFSGFVSRHFIEFLDRKKINASILGIDVNTPGFDISTFKFINCKFKKINLLDKQQTETIIKKFKPDYILHLASFSSVAFSWKNPTDSFVNNTNIFLNLIDAVRTLDIKCRILSVGSSEEYGNVNTNNLPLTESQLLKPLSPYAVARVSQEMLSKVYVDGYNMDIILTRSFNHLGPRQPDIFVVSSFAKQLVEIKRRKKPGWLLTGDVSVVRDFIDVRDVVEAYYLLFQKGRKGNIYNICSGVGTELKEVIYSLSGILKIKVEIKINKSLIRPNDNKIIVGSNKKIKNETGWRNRISLDQSLTDIINYWEKE